MQYTDMLGEANQRASAGIAAAGQEIAKKAGAIAADNLETELGSVITAAHADQQRKTAMAAKLHAFEQNNLASAHGKSATAAKAGAAAAKGGGAANSGAAKAAKEYTSNLDALIKRFLPARDDAENLAEATAVLDKAMAKGDITGTEYGEMLKKLKKDYDTAANAAQDLIDKYDREGAAARTLAEDSEGLNKIIAEGGPAAERAKVALAELGKQQAKNGKEADAWTEVWKNAVKRIDDTFANLWEDLFSGGKSALASLKKAITSWLAEVAHALITKPLVVAITAGVTRTATAGAGGGTTKQGLDFFSKIGSYLTSDSIGKSFASGINNFAKLFGEVPAGLKVGLGNLSTVPNWAMGAGAIGGSLLGTAIFGNKGYSAIGSSIGSVAGTIIAGALATGPLAPFIVVAAGLLSGIAGGGLGSLFGAKEPRPGAYAAITHGGTGMLEDGVGAKGSFGLTFGMSDIGTSGLDANEMKEVFEGFAKVSNVLADFYGKDVAAQVKASLEKASNEAWSKNGIMRYAMDVNQAFDVAFTDIINHAAATGDTLAVVMQAVVGDLNGTAENMAQQIEAGMQAAAALVGTATALEDTEIGALLNLTGTLTENALLLGAYANNMKESGETTAEAVARMVTNLAGLDAALILTSGHTNATGEDFIYLSNMLAKAAEEAKISMESLIQIQNAYYAHFFTEEERALKQKEDSLKAIDKWNQDQGLEGIDTSAEFRAYIESLDLNTEAGRAAYVEAMKLVGAFITLDDALDKLKDTITDATDAFAEQRNALRDFAERLDPTNYLSRERLDQADQALRDAGYGGNLRDAAGIAEFLRLLAAMDDAGGEAGDALRDFFRTFDEVFDALVAAAEQHASLMIRLAGAMGDDALVLRLQREQELNSALDDTNRAILRHIYLLEDARSALKAAYAALERAVNAERDQIEADYQARVDAITAEREALDAAHTTRVEAINAEREALDAAHTTRVEAINAEREAVQAQMQAAQEALAQVDGIVNSIQSALAALRGQAQDPAIALDNARRQLAAWAASGTLPDQETFDRAMAPLGSDDRGSYASELEYRATQQATYANLLVLEKLGLAKKTDAQRQLEELEAQTKLLDEQLEQEDRLYQEQIKLLEEQLDQENRLYQERIKALDEQLKQAKDWRDAEMKRLDAILEDAREKLDIALGTYTAVLSIDEALKALNKAMSDFLVLMEIVALFDPGPTPDAPPQGALPLSSEPMSAANEDQTRVLSELKAEVVLLRQDQAAIATAQVSALKSLDSRLLKWDLDGSPPWRDDGTGTTATILKVA
ncbi:MAG: hypothetical protein KAY97_02140 [Chromatiaceae bacterium]|nr:hypothetical protein [Chromatiaceae bacterium]